MNQTLLGKFLYHTSNFLSLNFTHPSWVMKHNFLVPTSLVISSLLMWWLMHTVIQTFSRGKICSPILTEELTIVVFDYYSFAADLCTSNLNLSAAPLSTHSQFPAAHLHLDILPSHPTILAWKGTHNLSSQSSLPVSVNAVTGQKKLFFN